MLRVEVSADENWNHIIEDTTQLTFHHLFGWGNVHGSHSQVTARIHPHNYANSLSSHASNFTANEKDIKIYYYSHKMSGVLIPHENFQSAVAHTDFSPTKKTIFVIHGWLDGHEASVNVAVRQAYLQVADVNVFIIDWSSISKTGYLNAQRSVPQVAGLVGKLINAMTTSNHLNLDNTILVGHSLGAHVAGLTGAALHGRVNTIVGLDPAGPGFSQGNLAGRLDPSDGKFVQAVHTCPGLLGANYRVGHSDYFANNGRSQPGCGIDPTGSCAHGRSYLYFAESVKSGKFIAHQCSNWADFHAGKCAKNHSSRMGELNVDRTASGTYYFETNASPPWAKW